MLKMNIIMLQDQYKLEVEIDEENLNILWNVNSIKIKLKPDAEIIETRQFYNPSYAQSSFGEKIINFQKMWEPSHSSFIVFSCILNHWNRNSHKCDHFCSQFSMPECGMLTYFFSTNAWPD